MYHHHRYQMSSGSHLEPIPLVSVEKQGGESIFEVKPDALHNILMKSDVKDKPLAIISIAGGFRSGKSFLMNFLLRYLKNEGWRNKNWMGPDNMKVVDGFSWKRGKDADTQGINIWPEVFFVNKEGREIAVLLVDTQGLYDNNTDPNTNAKIMSLSTLLSSHQLLNISKQIDSRDLEHLQLCVEYAFEAKKVSGESMILFQNLTMLVRDWRNSHENDYGLMGGNEYLSEMLKSTERESNVVSNVKKSVMSAFDDAQCFLLPFPGKKVDQGEKSKLTNADIDKEFKIHLNQLVKYLAHPANLIEKKFNSRTTKSSELIKIIAAIGKCFKDDQMPKISTLLETHIDAIGKDAISSATAIYNKGMGKIFSEVSGFSELKNYHKIYLKQAKAHFLEAGKFGREQPKQKFLDEMVRECEDLYQKMCDGYQRRQKYEAWIIFNNLLKIYKGKIEQVRRSRLLEYALKEWYDVTLNRILEEYDKKTASLSAIMEFKSKARSTLKLMAEREYFNLLDEINVEDLTEEWVYHGYRPMGWMGYDNPKEEMRRGNLTRQARGGMTWDRDRQGVPWKTWERDLKSVAANIIVEFNKYLLTSADNGSAKISELLGQFGQRARYQYVSMREKQILEEKLQQRLERSVKIQNFYKECQEECKNGYIDSMGAQIIECLRVAPRSQEAIENTFQKLEKDLENIFGSEYDSNARRRVESMRQQVGEEHDRLQEFNPCKLANTSPLQEEMETFSAGVGCVVAGFTPYVLAALGISLAAGPAGLVAFGVGLMASAATRFFAWLAR